MHVSYVKLFCDDEGVVRHSEEADSEFQQLRQQIKREQQTIDDLRELLDAVRRIAYELNQEVLKDSNAKTKE